jgi:hypothetical protein
VQRTAVLAICDFGLGRLCGLDRLICKQRYESMQTRLMQFDPSKHGLHNLNRRNPA